MSVAPTPLSADDLANGPSPKEFILLAGKDGVGKTSAIISLAQVIGIMNPDARFFVIDTENKFASTYRGFGDDRPTNITYYKVTDMNEATEALDAVMDAHTPGDWLGVESAGRLWERAQDLGYKAITGLEKAAYMEKRRAQAGKKDPVTPRPDDLWSIVKGAHDGAFIDLLAQTDSLNVLLTTTVSKPPKDMPNRKENADRKDLRVEFGIDLGLDGAPRLPYYVQTLALLDRRGGEVGCRILRDNNSVHENAQVEFTVQTRKTWGGDFLAACRG